jgi:hypothetical protein
MNEPRHERDENGICWITRTVKGETAWILCGRASYESTVRCDEHSPLSVDADAEGKE